MQIFWDWFRWLYDTTGVNLSIFYDAFDRGRFFAGLLMTLRLSVICIVLSIVLGMLGAWLQGSRSRLVRGLVYWYIQFFRNTPPLVQLFFFYFGLGGLLTTTGPSGSQVPLVGNITWAIISLSFFAAAFNTEIFRSGVQAVSATTIEAAQSLGFSRLRTYILIVFPLALRISLPALANNLINLLKTTTLAYAIAVPEMLYVTSQIWSDELNVAELMNVLLVSYVILAGLLAYLMRRWERALSLPGFGA